jgi:hypothetical protein
MSNPRAIVQVQAAPAEPLRTAESVESVALGSILLLTE